MAITWGKDMTLSTISSDGLVITTFVIAISYESIIYIYTLFPRTSMNFMFDVTEWISLHIWISLYLCVSRSYILPLFYQVIFLFQSSCNALTVVDWVTSILLVCVVELCFCMVCLMVYLYYSILCTTLDMCWIWWYIITSSTKSYDSHYYVSRERLQIRHSIWHVDRWWNEIWLWYRMCSRIIQLFFDIVTNMYDRIWG